MSTFTLAISCLTTSNLPWFMDLTFQVPSNSVLYSIGLYFHHQSHSQLGAVFLWFHLFILSEVIFHSFPVAYSVPTDLGSSSFSVLPFCLFILLMGFSRQECWCGLPFPFPVDHILSEFSTWQNDLSVLCGPTCMAHSFTESDKTVIYS